MTRTNQKNNIFSARLLPVFITCFVLAFSGCKKKQEEPPPPTPPVKPKVVVHKAISSASPNLLQANQLDFSTKKDPFKPYVAVKTANLAELARQKKAMKTELPIHSYDVSQFKLIGTVVDPKGNKAMVVDPAGKGYVLRLGMTIGKNEGKIIKIFPNGIEVLEQFYDDNNKIRKETIRIPLLRKP